MHKNKPNCWLVIISYLFLEGELEPLFWLLFDINKGVALHVSQHLFTENSEYKSSAILAIPQMDLVGWNHTFNWDVLYDITV